MAKLRCRFCGYEWTPRSATPKACPSCKRYKYSEEKEVKALGD